MTASGMPQIVREQAGARPSGIALRRKAMGIWEETTWAELDALVGRLALGLASTGAQPGDPVAVIGDTTPQWIATDLALQALGARVVTPWPRLEARELIDDLRRARARLAVCGDQEQLDRLGGAGLETIVVDATGLGGDRPEGCGLLEELEQTGGQAPRERYGQLLAARTPEDEVAVSFDAAGSGPDRGAVVHRAAALVAAAQAVVEAGRLGPTDRTLCVLPLASLTARVLDVYAPIVAGATIHVPESAASVPGDLAEVAPTVLSLSPRALELVRSSAQVRAARSRPFKQRMLRWAQPAAGAGGSRVAGLLVRRPAARQLGLGSLRRITSVGGPLTESMVGFFGALGPEVLVAEGPVRVCGLALLDGRPLPGVEARVDEGGRLAVAAPWEGTPLTPGAPEPELLAREDDDGRIVVAGGRDDLVGDDALPALEAQLRDSPYLTEAALDEAPGGPGTLVAVVGLDVDAVGVWAGAHDVHAATLRGLADHPAVHDLAAAEVERLLPGRAIASVVVMPRRLSESRGELTPMLDVRRAGIASLLQGPTGPARGAGAGSGPAEHGARVAG